MNIYDLDLYEEVDRNFVQSIYEMKVDETADFEMQNMIGEPIYENDGVTKVVVSLDKTEVERFLRLVQSSGKTFNQVFVEAVTTAAEYEKAEYEKD